MNIKEIFNTMEYGPAPESNKESLQFLEKHNRKFNLFINNNWVEPDSKKYYDTTNPSNHSFLSKVADANEKDVDKAVQAAKKALPAWVKTGGHERAKYLYALARQIQKHSRVIAVLESMDNGKPIRETRDIDIPLVVRHFYHHAGWAQLMESEMKDYQEIGVVGQIIPWNFPLLMLAWKIAPALAMGNTVVLKPAESTSLTALFFAELCQQAGLPPGVVNIVTGYGGTGAALVQHPDVHKIAFTGSTEVGKLIRKSTAGTGKKISLELGGKSPFIVFEDADLDSVVEGVVDAIWFNQGQVCCAGSRLLVQESVATVLYEKLKNRIESFRVGDALDKCIDMGAIVSTEQLKVIQDLVQEGKDEGNTMWQPTWECPENGCYFPPTIFTDVSPSAKIAQEEIFGPVLVAMTFRSHSEAVKLANNTRFGLASSIWTENINLALDIAPQVKAGTVWINCTNVFDAASGFGGYRESGFGREGGKEGLYEYVKPKTDKELLDGPKKTKPELAKSNIDLPSVDVTYKLYIGGKQVRPDGGNSLIISNDAGEYLGEVPKGSRKDIRDAVEAAHSNAAWSNMTGHGRAQVLYYLAENLLRREEEWIRKIIKVTLQKPENAEKEWKKGIERIFYYAAKTDKYDGLVHHTVQKNVTLAMPEPIGVMAIVPSDDSAFLGLLSLLLPALTMGNRVLLVPSEKFSTLALDLYQIMDTSDIPGGTVNIITGKHEELVPEMAKHFDIDGMWYFGTEDLSKQVELLSVGNLKRTWVNYGKYRNWLDNQHGQGDDYLRHASQIKNIWIPYGA
ncbi:MAG: aldehyde dehydrogenase family protein [Saprospiraceae bacterium]|nr:aldehyde dehydrogenase family protein [Saprospiraceae bacterium]